MAGKASSPSIHRQLFSSIFKSVSDIKQSTMTYTGKWSDNSQQWYLDNTLIKKKLNPDLY